MDERANRRVRNIKRAKKAVFYVLLILFAFLLYSDPYLSLFGWKPNLMITIAACAVAFEGPCMSTTLAAVCGLMTDMVRQTPFGFNTLLFFVLTLGLWMCFHFWLRSVPLNAFFAALLLSGVFHAVDCWMMYGFGSGLFASLYLGDMLSTAAAVFVLYWPVRAVYRRLRFTL